MDRCFLAPHVRGKKKIVSQKQRLLKMHVERGY